MSRKRPGRPRLPANERSGAILTIRLRRSEKSALETAAKSEGLSLSEWARRALLRGIKMS